MTDHKDVSTTSSSSSSTTTTTTAAAMMTMSMLAGSNSTISIPCVFNQFDILTYYPRNDLNFDTNDVLQSCLFYLRNMNPNITAFIMLREKNYGDSDREDDSDGDGDGDNVIVKGNNKTRDAEQNGSGSTKEKTNTRQFTLVVNRDFCATLMIPKRHVSCFYFDMDTVDQERNLSRKSSRLFDMMYRYRYFIQYIKKYPSNWFDNNNNDNNSTDSDDNNENNNNNSSSTIITTTITSKNDDSNV
jgi:hypothetical protein